MEEYFFSEKNVGDLTKQLITNLELGQNELNNDVVIKCRNIIVKQMKNTYDRFGNQKPNNIGTKEYIAKMNNKSLKDCMKIFDLKNLKLIHQIQILQGQNNQVIQVNMGWQVLEIILLCGLMK